jgi:hypothetical protein
MVIFCVVANVLALRVGADVALLMTMPFFLVGWLLGGARRLYVYLSCWGRPSRVPRATLVAEDRDA